MTIALISHTLKQGNSHGSGASTGINTSGANLIVGCVGDYQGNPAAVFTDSNGNTWTSLTRQTNIGSACAHLVYCLNPIVGAGHTFTVTSSIDPSYSSLSVAAFSGVLIASAFDVQNGNSGSGATLTSGSITPTQAGELIIMGLGSNQSGTVSIDTGTIIEQATIIGGNSWGNSLAYLIQGAASTINPTWTIPGNPNAAVIAAFKAQPATSGQTSNFFLA